MRKKKNLWSGVSILIVAVLVITAFIRGNAQAWLLAAAFVIWAVWATYYFLVPYIKEELHKREAKRIRKKCEKQDAAFDRFIIPEVSDPVEQVLLRHANYRISAYLQSVYPNATWEWREEFPERIIAKAGTGRVKLFGVDGYNFADVTFDQNGGINCALVNIVPLKQPNAPHPSVSDTEDMPLLWHFCVHIPIRPMKRSCHGICRSLRRSSSRHRKNWSAAANRPVGPIMRKKFHATAQEAVKTSGAIFRKEDRIPYEKRNECKRPDCISAGGRLPRRYFNRQRTHLYFACR